jgi:hypothetical protein
VLKQRGLSYSGAAGDCNLNLDSHFATFYPVCCAR